MGLEKNVVHITIWHVLHLVNTLIGQILKINFQFQMGGGSVDRKCARTMSRASSSGGVKESKSVK